MAWASEGPKRKLLNNLYDLAGRGKNSGEKEADHRAAHLPQRDPMWKSLHPPLLPIKLRPEPLLGCFQEAAVNCT